MRDVALTEMTDLDPDTLHLVKNGANGFPALLAKSVAEEIEEAAKQPHDSDTPSPEADADQAERTGSSAKGEAEDQLAEMTDEAAKGLCFVDGCEVCAPVLAKAKLKASQRRALDRSQFAIPEKAPGPGSYPINDKAHQDNALARSSGKPVAARVRAAVARARKEQEDVEKARIKQTTTWPVPKQGKKAKKSPGVPAESVATPREAGHERSTGQSGQRIADMTDGAIHPHDDPSFHGGGESPYVIPNEELIDPHGKPDVPHAINRLHQGSELTKTERFTVTQLFAALQREQLRKDAGGFMAVDNPDAGTPGSPAWENYDSATLGDIASTLASCGKAIDAMMRREAIEAAAGDAGDVKDTWDLSMAGDALDNALSIVARLAFHEGAAAKAEEEIAEKSDLTNARNRLTAVFGDENNQPAEHNGSAKKGTITVETTPSELGSAIVTAVEKAMDKRDKQAKKEAKKADKLARKNANNGGDISEATLRAGVTARTDADDVGSVGNGVVKGGNGKLKKEVKALREKLEKVAGQPQTGGPILDGQPRGTQVSAGDQGGMLVKGADGRDYQVIKGLDGKDYEVATTATIDAMEKELQDTLAQKGPDAANRASALGYQLTRAKLVRAHLFGEA